MTGPDGSAETGVAGENRPERQPGENRPERQPGENRPQRQPGESRPQRQSGEKRPQRQPGENQPRRQPADGQAQRQSTDVRTSEGRPGDGRPGEGRRGKRRRGRKPGGSPAAATGHAAETGPERAVAGFLDVGNQGAGVLRHAALTSPDDARLPARMVRELALRPGDLVEGTARGDTLQSVTLVNGVTLEALAGRRTFSELTAVHPESPLVLGSRPGSITGRLLDLIAPVGKGQRGLIVAPPKAGKTTLLRDIALGLGEHRSLTILTLLVAERPEEVTELRRTVPGSVLAADLDQPSQDHIRVASLGVEHAKRLVEMGRDVVILLDSLTRLARAHNLALRGGSRTMSGGMDAAALFPVRQAFGAARAAEEGGSLTILATCLIDTGSKMDDLVYEEFKGTGNMEVHLDRALAEKRLFPAIDVSRSGTRREELLLDPKTYQQVTALRRKLAGVPPDQALTALLEALHRGYVDED